MSESALNAVRKLVEGAIERRQRIPRSDRSVPLFPLEIEVGGRAADLHAAVLEWLDDPAGPRIGVLKGPIGSGKTIATCRLARFLVDNERFAGWMPMRRARYFLQTPRGAFSEEIGQVFISSADSASPELLILDGLDEMVAQTGPVEVCRWLDALLSDELFQDSRVLVSSREEGFVETAQRSLRRCLDEHNLRAAGRDEIIDFGLLEWRHEDQWKALEAELEEQGGDPSDLDRLIHPSVLTSPLLFYFTYCVLAGPEILWGSTPITDERDLLDAFVRTSLLRDGHHREATASWEQRRDFARNLALFLVVSGRGTAGTTLDELDRPERRWIWAPLVGGRRVGLEEIEVALGATTKDIFHSCLLTQRNGYFAPFHQRLLVHLASGAMNTIASTAHDDFDHGFADPPWDELGTLLEQPGLPRFAELALGMIEPAAINADSDLDQMFRYWARPYGAEPGEHAAQLTVPVDADPTSAAMAFMLRDAIDGSSKSAWVMSDHEFAPVPSGSFWAWRLGPDGNRRLGLVEVPDSVHLGVHLVTVAEYAQYLSENPDVEVPHQPDVGWRRDADVTFDPEHASTPVAGVSVADAEDYVDWVGEELGDDIVRRIGVDPESGYRFSLPEADWLHGAIGGAERAPLSRLQGVTPNGHSALVCTLWHATASGGGGQAVLFGGSPAIASGNRRRAVKELAIAFPDYTRRLPRTARDPNVGVRIAILTGSAAKALRAVPEEPVATKRGKVQLTAGRAGTPAADPEGDPKGPDEPQPQPGAGPMLASLVLAICGEPRQQLYDYEVGVTLAEVAGGVLASERLETSWGPDRALRTELWTHENVECVPHDDTIDSLGVPAGSVVHLTSPIYSALREAYLNRQRVVVDLRRAGLRAAMFPRDVTSRASLERTMIRADGRGVIPDLLLFAVARWPSDSLLTGALSSLLAGRPIAQSIPRGWGMLQRSERRTITEVL